MTAQAKAFQWSVGIHGMLLLIVVLLQSLAASQTRVAVIDFTLSGNNVPSMVEQPSPPQAPSVRQASKRAKAVRPKTVVEENNVPLPKAEQPQAPSDVSSNGEESPTSLPPVVGGPGRPSAEGVASSAPSPGTADGMGSPSTQGASRHVADTNGLTQGTAGSSGDANAGVTPEASRAAYLKEHFTYIRDRITGSISYPHMARKMGWCGQVKIAFVVREDGGVNEVRVVESSGFSLLDRNAVDTVKTVAPFPNPPVRAEIKMAITYRLN